MPVLAQNPSYGVPRNSTPGGTFLSGRPLACGNPECSRNWLAFLKDRRRPVFERAWGCSPHCIATIVETAVRRELGEQGRAIGDRPHRHRMPLGLILLQQGRITHAQLQRALDLQRRARSGSIGQWLIEQCGLPQECVTHALGMQWGCPVVSVDGFIPNAMALAVPRLLVERLGMLPLRIAGERILYLAFAGQPDASAAFALERMSGLKVECALVDQAQWRAARERLCDSDFVDAAFDQVGDTESMVKDIAFTLGKIRPISSRLVRVHQFFWLRMWLETGPMSARDGGIPSTREDVADHIYWLAEGPGFPVNSL